MSSSAEGETNIADLLLAIDHVGMAVSELDVAIDFHVEVLGLHLLHRENNEEQGVAEAMLAPAGSWTGAAQVQLVAPLTSDSVLTRFIDRSVSGLHHLAYRVSDVDAVAAVLRRRGLRLLYDSAKAGTRGSRINFIHPKDTGGVLIELVEPAE
jgi:methylmalonyl-CoA/ethylmalonyl-CoA epimerase